MAFQVLVNAMILISAALTISRGTAFIPDFKIYDDTGKLIPGMSDVQTSPNYPDPYNSDSFDSWKFETIPGNRIKLVFEYFDLEPKDNCEFDYVTIYDGGIEDDQVLGIFCGSKIPPTIVSKLNSMTMTFRSDASVQKTGFKAVYTSVPGSIQSCTADQFPCLNGKCVRRSWFCDNADDCGDNSDEDYCNKDSSFFAECPVTATQWTFCADRKRCYPSVWKCNGIKDCEDGSDERKCETGIKSISGVSDTKTDLRDYYIRAARQHTRLTNKWGTHTSRAAVALFLSEPQFFAPGVQIGEELAYQLSLELLSKLTLKKKISTNDLALFINALTVVCIDPKDFFGVNAVYELRKRVTNNNYTNPFYILTLCNARDAMTKDDVLKLQKQYDAHLRPIWTDTQAMVIMALSCISSRSNVSLDERILDEMVSELKKKQHKNGTVENLKSTALVVQALLAAENYRSDFDLDTAIKATVQEVRRAYPSIQDIYYILPIFNSMSLAKISSDHCEKQVRTGLEVTDRKIKSRESADERIQVKVSVIIGSDKDFSSMWKVKVCSNDSLYQVLENIRTLEPAYEVRYTVSEGKPYVAGVAKFEDDTQDGFFWFIYTKPLSSSGRPKLIKESPVDIQVKENEEVILWYRSGSWETAQDDSSNQDDSPTDSGVS